MSVNKYTHTHTQYSREPKRMPDPLGLDLCTAVSCHVNAGN